MQWINMSKQNIIIVETIKGKGQRIIFWQFYHFLMFRFQIVPPNHSFTHHGMQTNEKWGMLIFHLHYSTYPCKL
jgi:hypothetical protein